MLPAHLTAVSTSVPDSSIVFDHFQFIKLFNEELTELPRDLHSTFGLERLPRNVLTGTRKLFLTNPVNLDKDRNEHLQLEVVLNLNKPLATVYSKRQK